MKSFARKIFKNLEKLLRKLLRRSVMCYEYITSWEKLEEELLPLKKILHQNKN